MDILLIRYISKTMSIAEVNVQISRESITTRRDGNYLPKITFFRCQWTKAIKIHLIFYWCQQLMPDITHCALTTKKLV